MQINSFVKTFLLVISVGSMASAQLVPGPSHGGGGGLRPAPYPGGGGGLVPGPRPLPPPGGPGYPGHPGQPYPGNPYPGNPYPGDPYPGRPLPPRPLPPPPRPLPPPMPPRPLPPPPRPLPPPQPPVYGDYDVKRIYVSRDLINQSLDLRSSAGLYGYNGWTITSVRANTRPNGAMNAMAHLVVDGRVVASQANPGYQIYLIPQSAVVLEQNAWNVQLSIGGGLFIDSVEIELRRGGGYNPPPPVGQRIDISVYRTVSGSDRIDLTTLVDLWRYRGYRIEQMSVTASSRWGSGSVNLLVNGFDSGRLYFSQNYSESQTMWLSNQPVIGQGADSLVLYTSGDMTIESVSLIIR